MLVLLQELVLLETGNHVICVDIDAKKVERTRNGEIPIYEPGLETIFHAISNKVI